MKQPEKQSHVVAAALAYEGNTPEWVKVLAETCDAIGQPAAAQRIGFVTSVVSQTLRNKYKGRVDRVEQAVKGAFMGATVLCPVYGNLRRDACVQKQRLPFAATSPERVQLWRQCPGCPNYRGRRTPEPSSSQQQPETQP